MASNRSAVNDGKLVRQFTKFKGTNKRKYRLTPDEVVGLIKRHIRRTMGDWMENNSEVYGAQGGFFFIKLPYRTAINHVEDDFWRNAFRTGVKVKRHSIGYVLRAMHGELLTSIEG